METRTQWTIISLGGSILVPEKVDGLFLEAFTALIAEQVALGHHFAIITGGGKICRQYQDALLAARSDATPTELDWLGIYTTRFNAELVRMAFGDMAEPKIFTDPKNLDLVGKPILVGGGTEPGHSSDGAAVELAQTLGAVRLLNLSNIDHVYTADPRKNPSATPIELATWTEFRKLLPKEWDPGASAPFDPVAAEMAENMGLEVAVMNGTNLPNLKNYLEGKDFIGTVIK